MTDQEITELNEFMAEWKRLKFKNEIVCPHCGFEHKEDLYEHFYDSDETQMACQKCDQQFEVQRHTTYQYSTSKELPI